MYERGKEVNLEASVGVMVKNLQVVSFDSEWLEIYLGTVCKTTITSFQIIMKVLYNILRLVLIKNFIIIIIKVRRDNFLAVCPNKVKGATTVNVSWNYSESAGSAVAAALDADVSISIFTILLSSIF